ncbi:acyltransferase [Bradyrhizobium sp. 45]|nr:acyltransferase [Bradyrhizobium sp. 45]
MVDTSCIRALKSKRCREIRAYGVDVFFVISSYLISQLLLREIAATGKLDFLGFYGRRAKRLLPAALAVTVATLTIGYFVLAPFEQKEMAKSATASALYAANVWLLRQSTNYFAPESSLNPFLHSKRSSEAHLIGA